jgi:glucose-1-phosphate thymidylyltransferase
LAENFTIVIPMAGLGTRMRPQTWSKPKPLIHLAGKTVLDYVLKQFQSIPRFKYARFVLILGPNQGEQVIPFMKENHPEKEVHYVIQEEMRGQSDAISLAKEFLQAPTLIAFSDTLIESDLSGLDDDPSDGIAWVKQVPDPRRFGVAEVNQDGFISRLIEKPKGKKNNLVVVGFYYFKNGNNLIQAIDQQIKSNIELNGEYFLTDAINLMIENGAKIRTESVDIWLDAGKPGALLKTNCHLLENGFDNSYEASKRKNVTILSPVYIHPEAQIKNCVIGPHVSISQGATIENTVLKNSIVEQDATITNMVLENSLIGRTAAVRGRAETMNIGDNSWIEI